MRGQGPGAVLVRPIEQLLVLRVYEWMVVIIAFCAKTSCMTAATGENTIGRLRLALLSTLAAIPSPPRGSPITNVGMPPLPGAEMMTRLAPP